MARVPRSLIIACENYPKGEDVVDQLPGSLKAAKGFYEWLVSVKGVAVDNIYLCCDDPVVPAHPSSRTYQGARSDIVSAIVDLATQGKDETSELYVFFSGHGIGWEVAPQQRGLDVLLASDYRRRQISGASCIRVDELRSEMRKCLGGEDHYYFLDACRTVMKVGEIVPAELGLALSLATSGEPTTYVLYSTKFGEAAKINSGFSEALVAGLKGAGRAKQKTQGNWWVRFDRVQKFVQEKLKAKTDLAKDGAGDGLILQLQQVDPTLCTVKVENAHPTDTFAFTAEVSGVEQPFVVTGSSFEKALLPSDDGYRFNLKANERSLPRLEPPPDKFLDLFDPVTLRYTTREVGVFRGGGTPPLSGVEVRGVPHPGIEVRIQNPSTGETLASAPPVPEGATHWIPLPAGTQIAETLENGRIVRRAELDLKPGERLQFDPLSEPESRIQRSIVGRLPRIGRLPDASETLQGPIAQQDTALWLSILGASRIIRKPSDFSKLGQFSLATFDDLYKGDSVLYALAGLEAENSIQVAVSQREVVAWQPMSAVDGLDGVYQFQLKLQMGSQLVSFALPGVPPVTYATYALPNRAILLVFDVDSTGRFNTRQMLLPVYSLTQYLDWTVKQRFEQESLRLIKYLSLAQERFANRVSLAQATPEEQQRWNEMLYGKWIDPLFAIMAIFEAARRGKTREAAQNMSDAITNLNQYFGELPDVFAASKLLGMDSRPPTGPPLLLESLQNAPDLKKLLPLSADFIDYNSMWTSWFGAVNAPPGPNRRQ